MKFAGYSLAAQFISRSYERTDRSALVVGGVRTLIGMAAGAAYFGVWHLMADATGAGDLWYLMGLLPVRLIEWWLLLWLFYDRPLQQRPKGWRTVFFATVWSYALDVPAVVGFFVTGGMWVC